MASGAHQASMVCSSLLPPAPSHPMLTSFRRRLASRIAPSPEAPPTAGTRREFFRRAAGATALGVGALVPLDAWAAVEERAGRLGITPGTLVDASGKPLNRPSRFGDPLIASVGMFAGNFAPRGWAFCQGQLLAIASNTALFSLLGTTYGGDGRTTFALPDLRGRMPIHPGTGPGLSTYRLGQRGGVQRVTLTRNQAAHSHGASSASTSVGDSPDPRARVPAVPASSIPMYGAPTGSMAATQNAGGNQQHENRPPSLAINFIIALVGIYPSRS